LKERIKVLEQGWASVVQALTAAGQSIPALGLPPSLTQETKPTNPRLETDSSNTIESSGYLRGQSPSLASVTSTPSLTFSSLSASSDDSARHPARMANTSDSLTSVPEVSLPRAKFSSTRKRSRVSNTKTPLSPSQRKQILRSTYGCRISCFPIRLHLLPHHRQRSPLLRLLPSKLPRTSSRSKG
jgi:hypothetical protein